MHKHPLILDHQLRTNPQQLQIIHLYLRITHQLLRIILFNIHSLKQRTFHRIMRNKISRFHLQNINHILDLRRDNKIRTEIKFPWNSFDIKIGLQVQEFLLELFPFGCLFVHIISFFEKHVHYSFGHLLLLELSLVLAVQSLQGISNPFTKRDLFTQDIVVFEI